MEYLGLEPCFLFRNIIILLVGKVSRFVAKNGCLFHTRAWGFVFVRKFGHQFMLPDFGQPESFFPSLY